MTDFSANEDDLVVLVDADDRDIGTMGKMQAHIVGALHRAFSVFIFNSDGELLLQKRAKDKYHSAGLWTNSCCSHPRPHETVEQAASRRLSEEIGLGTTLTNIFSFSYNEVMDSALIENEIDHVLVGVSDDKPTLNPLEVDAFRYASPETIRHEIELYPDRFTVWFKLCFERVISTSNQRGLVRTQT